MPNAIVLEKKQQQVAALSENVSAAVTGVIVDYKGIDVADDTALRKELRENGVQYTVVKNTILRKAVEGTDLAEMEPFFNGTTALATSTDDHVAAARILNNYAEKSETFIFGSKAGASVEPLSPSAEWRPARKRAPSSVPIWQQQKRP